MGLLLLVYSIRLQTSITETGLSYRFTLLQGKPTEILWTNITTADIRQYKPGKEYGGWGIRYSKESGKAINASGNIGLQLITNTGNKILIGTNKKDELASVMEQLYKKGLVKQGSEANIKERH